MRSIWSICAFTHIFEHLSLHKHFLSIYAFIHIFEYFSLHTHFRVFKPSHEKHLEHLSFYTHFRAFKPSYTFWASHKSFHVEQSETLTEWKFESVADRRPADGHLTWVGAGDTWVSKKVCQVHILKFWWAYIFCVPSTYGFLLPGTPPLKVLSSRCI